MSATVASESPEQLARDRSERRTTTVQTGAVSFSDLVRAHFRREQERSERGGAASPAAEDEFCAKLEEFEHAEGKLTAVYWSTRNASAVAMTMAPARSARNPIAETEMKVRLHRVTDWVTKEADAIADLLQECDLLAIRVSEILRGTSERISMRWIYAVQEHLLGFIERSDGRPSEKEQREVVAAQRKQLARIEEYYLRTAAKAGRIVYVSGLMFGAAFIATLCAVVAAVLAATGHSKHEVQLLLLCAGAGAVGALVSVLGRMSGGTDKFTVDFEVGRPLLRRLGLYKPLVGSVFGVALYMLLKGGLLMTKPPAGQITYFYGIIAFFAGFSERFTGVIFGSAQRLISGEDEPTPRADPAAQVADQGGDR